MVLLPNVISTAKNLLRQNHFKILHLSLNETPESVQ